MRRNLKMCENVIDDDFKDLVHITKSMKTMSFTPQRIQDFLLQLLEKYSIPLFSDLLTERRSIKSGYGVQFEDDMITEIVFRRLVEIIERYNLENVRIWSTDCYNCEEIWDDIIYKTPHDVICPYCRQKNANIVKIEDTTDEKLINQSA